MSFQEKSSSDRADLILSSAEKGLVFRAEAWRWWAVASFDGRFDGEPEKTAIQMLLNGGADGKNDFLFEAYVWKRIDTVIATRPYCMIWAGKAYMGVKTLASTHSGTPMTNIRAKLQHARKVLIWFCGSYFISDHTSDYAADFV